MPLPLTRKEQKMLTVVLVLLALGLIGRAIWGGPPGGAAGAEGLTRPASAAPAHSAP